MHVDEFIFNCCVSSMLSDDISESSPESSAMNVFSIDENKIRDANGIIFAEAITCYKCTFCGKMFAAMEVVLTHYQSNHRSSVIPLLSTGLTKVSSPKPRPVPFRPVGVKKFSKAFPYGPIKSRTNVLSESTNEWTPKTTNSNVKTAKKYKCFYPGCIKAFTYKLGLQNHQMTHKKLKSYKCDWNDCKFKCSDLAGLRFHKNTHSGDKPFKCVWPGCMQSFPDATTKETHLQTEHIKDAILECEYPSCGAKFSTASERESHNATHVTKRRSRQSLTPKQKAKSQGKRLGRPPKRKQPVDEIISSSSSEASNSGGDNSESSEEEDIEDDENLIEDKPKDLTITKKIDDQKDEDSKNEPLDLSKTAIDLTKEKKTENKIPAKRGRKRKKSLEKKNFEKTVYRCDYPGCRKTYSNSDLLHEHEKEVHKNLSSDGRSRYERRCKGNLYYKI